AGRACTRRPGRTSTGWRARRGAGPGGGGPGSGAASSGQTRPSRASSTGDGGRIVSTASGRDSADTPLPASRGRPASRDDQLDTLAGGQPEPLDPEAEGRQLARGRIAGARRREPPDGQVEHAERPPPERPRLAVVQEHERRARRQPIAERGEKRLPLRRPGPTAEEGDHGGSRHVAGARRREARRETRREAPRRRDRDGALDRTEQTN